MYNPNGKSTGSRIKDFMQLQVKDKFSFLYIEYAKIVQNEFSIAAYQNSKKVIIPLAMVNVLLLGPGTSITSFAIKNAADAGCTIIWCGQDLRYIYATGMISSECSKNLILQAKCYVDSKRHLDVVRRMYQIRYPDVCLDKFSLAQMRGMEGKRVKSAYNKYAKEYGMIWDGRNYDTENWDTLTTVNKLLNVGNSALYSVCQAAIIAFGMAPGLGFIHNGHTRSFVFDVADWYKEKFIIPEAFRLASQNGTEEDMRILCKDVFVKKGLMKSLSKNLSEVFGFPDITAKLPVDIGLWNLDDCVEFGVNYGGE